MEYYKTFQDMRQFVAKFRAMECVVEDMEATIAEADKQYQLEAIIDEAEKVAAEQQERIDAIEDALIELAEMVAGGEQ